MLPDSIPVSIWDEFKAHRKKIKAPMTEYAETLILMKLEKWRIESGSNPVDVINHSIEMGWRGVFLNGYAQMPESARTGTRDPEVTTSVCASCGKPLLSGFKHSSKGRLCHEC